MTNLTISPTAFETSIATLLSSVDLNNSTFAPFEEPTFDKVRDLLAGVGKSEWSKRPRTYTVLRLIDRVDAMDSFVLHGFLDMQFPYVESQLPQILSAVSRAKFLHAQRLTLSDVKDAEFNNKHVHLKSDATECFFVVKQLGGGSFGIVDHVRSKLSLEEYARKRIARARNFSRDKAQMKIFINELANLKRLRHEHLVRLVGSYTDPRHIGLLMDPIADCDLKQFLNQTPFPPGSLSLLRRSFGCLTSAVQYLHESKCRHKDLKPGNILVKGDKLLITDFGTARDWSDRTRGTTVGQSGPFTPAYAAPEVANQDSRGTPADIWSLGCVFLDIITVLKGESLENRRAFYQNQGTGFIAPCNNFEGFQSWVQNLHNLSHEDNKPLEWIKQMVVEAPRQRLDASQLFDAIISFESEQYYGDCCEDHESSDAASVIESEFETDQTIVLPERDRTRLDPISFAPPNVVGNLPETGRQLDTDQTILPPQLQPPKLDFDFGSKAENPFKFDANTSGDKSPVNQRPTLIPVSVAQAKTSGPKSFPVRKNAATSIEKASGNRPGPAGDTAKAKNPIAKAAYVEDAEDTMIARFQQSKSKSKSSAMQPLLEELTIPDSTTSLGHRRTNSPTDLPPSGQRTKFSADDPKPPTLPGYAHNPRGNLPSPTGKTSVPQPSSKAAYVEDADETIKPKRNYEGLDNTLQPLLQEISKEHDDMTLVPRRKDKITPTFHRGTPPSSTKKDGIRITPTNFDSPPRQMSLGSQLEDDGLIAIYPFCGFFAECRYQPFTNGFVVSISTSGWSGDENDKLILPNSAGQFKFVDREQFRVKALGTKPTLDTRASNSSKLKGGRPSPDGKLSTKASESPLSKNQHDFSDPGSLFAAFMKQSSPPKTSTASSTTATHGSSRYLEPPDPRRRSCSVSPPPLSSRFHDEESYILACKIAGINPKRIPHRTLRSPERTDRHSAYNSARAWDREPTRIDRKGDNVYGDRLTAESPYFGSSLRSRSEEAPHEYAESREGVYGEPRSRAHSNEKRYGQRRAGRLGVEYDGSPPRYSPTRYTPPENLSHATRVGLNNVSFGDGGKGEARGRQEERDLQREEYCQPAANKEAREKAADELAIREFRRLYEKDRLREKEKNLNAAADRIARETAAADEFAMSDFQRLREKDRLREELRQTLDAAAARKARDMAADEFALRDFQRLREKDRMREEARRRRGAEEDDESNGYTRPRPTGRDYDLY